MAFARNWRHAWVSETPERVSLREISAATCHRSAS